MIFDFLFEFVDGRFYDCILTLQLLNRAHEFRYLVAGLFLLLDILSQFVQLVDRRVDSVHF